MMTKITYRGTASKKFEEIGTGYVLAPNQSLMVPDAVAKKLHSTYPSEFEKARDFSSGNKMLKKSGTFKSK